jgi:hypothetical protein
MPWTSPVISFKSEKPLVFMEKLIPCTMRSSFPYAIPCAKEENIGKGRGIGYVKKLLLYHQNSNSQITDHLSIA